MAVPVVDVNARAESATCTTTGETTCEIVGLRNGTPYSVTVRAHGAEGDSVESAAVGPVTPVGEEPGTPGTETPGTETPGTGTRGGEGSDAGDSTWTGGTGTGSLATTGADPLPLLLVGGGVLVVGALATVVGLRRRTTMDTVEWTRESAWEVASERRRVTPRRAEKRRRSDRGRRLFGGRSPQCTFCSHARGA